MQAGTGALIGVLLFVTALTLFLQTTGQVDVRNAAPADLSWSKLGDKLLVVVVGLLLAGLFALYAASDIVQPYVQVVRVIIKNSMLWVMFLACMATSVFFSFDSLFTASSPSRARARRRTARAEPSVRHLADIGAHDHRHASCRGRVLFKTDAGSAYDKQIGNLAQAAQASTARSRRTSTTRSKSAIAPSRSSRSASPPRRAARRASPARRLR